jgi:amino acid adenylation domain-containing protein
VVGSPIAGRSRSEVEGLIGYFANTLPLRSDLSGNPSFRDLLHRVREVALEAYTHQDVPFDKLVEELRPERSLSHTPLFQVIFALENTPQALESPGLKMKLVEVDRSTSRCDLSLFVNDKGAELSCLWEYSTDLFAGETIERMMAAYEQTLESVLENPDQRIGYLPVLHTAERNQLLVEWNSAESEQVAEACMQQLFAAQAEKTPAAIALVFGDQKLTYQDLNARSNQLAHYLQKRGVGPEVPVGVCLERSADMVVALLAVLKAGGAYVPFDPNYPARRLAFMLEDSNVPVLLTQTQLLESFSEQQTQVVCVDDWTQFESESTDNPASSVTPENLAYVIYTSGSTGRPKGVEVKHRTVVHLFESTRDKLGFRSGEVWTVVHSSAFDFSVWEIWGALLQGGTLVVVPLDIVQSPAGFYDLLCREHVTILNQTPSALRELLRAKKVARQDWNVRLIVCGGDALDEELAAELVQLGIQAWNFYGPTESTVWTTCSNVAQIKASDTLNSIGRPIADLQVYLLDEFLQPVPIGLTGELFIGGAGLARGYLNRPGLTADRFIPNPFSRQQGARLYRTGDLARYRRHGLLEFLGRIDHQVKLRGFRIELGEIEAALSQHADIAQAVALIREDQAGDKQLLAYIVPRDGIVPSATDLRKYLQSSLPGYMVPSTFVPLDELPLTPNGKIDRLALPAPERSRPELEEEYIAPRTATEDVVAGIWAESLKLEQVGIHDNFFELGGHSLKATQVISRIREAFQVDLPLRLIFEEPTIVGLAEKIEMACRAEQGLQFPPIRPVSRDRSLPLSFAQQRLWFLDQLEPNSPFYSVPLAIRLKGLLNEEALEQSLNEIVRRHESLRTTFVTAEGEPLQMIKGELSLTMSLTDLRHLPEAEVEVEAQRLATEEAERPFDLASGPLIRTALLRLNNEDHILLLTMHHIISDGWSIGILTKELTALYEAFTQGQQSPLPDLAIQYADYAVWQREWLQGEVLEKQLSYWRQQLAGAPAALELPTDKPRPPVQTFRGAYHRVTLPKELSEQLKALAQHEGVTLYMLLLAAFQVLLSRHSGQHDIVVGTDVANRTQTETENLIGFFVNLLPMRTNLANITTFQHLLKQVREVALGAYAHQDLPFEKLVEHLQPERDLSRNPLVQVLFVFQNTPHQTLVLKDLDVSSSRIGGETSRFDLVLFIRETEQGIGSTWLYNADLFEDATISGMAGHFQILLHNILAQPNCQLNSLEMLSESEKEEQMMEKRERQESQIKKLRGIKRKAVDLSKVRDVRTTYLRPGGTLPLVIQPEMDEIDLADWAGSNRDFIETNLLSHGSILFRGFNVPSVSEFERFASAVCPELFGDYGDLPREQAGAKVYTSTPYPADETILFHNESSHMHRWPMKIWFCCLKAPEQGGESPIIDCRKAYQLMDQRIRERFAEKNLMYVRNYTDGLDVSWQTFFHTTDKSAVEDYCRKVSIDFEWRDGNNLRTRQICPAVVKHPQTGEFVFFNQIQLHHVSCLEPAVRESLLSMMREEDLPRNVYYGDGSPIEDSIVEEIGELYQKIAVSFPWREGDILMVNNMLIAHSRNPFVGARKIVVAMGEMINKTEI